MFSSTGRIASAEVVREDGERYLLLDTEKSAIPIGIEADRESLKTLIRGAERAMPSENAFRDDPPEDQIGLDDVESSEGSGDQSRFEEDAEEWWRDLEDDDLDISVTLEEKPEPGEYINPEDPSEW